MKSLMQSLIKNPMSSPMNSPLSSPLQTRLVQSPASIFVPALFAIATAFLAAAAPARAEIIDFNPEEDEVPTILDTADLDLLNALRNTSFVYFYTQPSPPSPDGQWALAFTGNGVGSINLNDGEVVEFADFPPFFNPSYGGWQDATTFGYVGTEVVPGEEEDDPPTILQHRIRLNVTDGSFEDEVLESLTDMAGYIASVSTDLETLLVVEPVEATGTLSAPREVTLGQSPYAGSGLSAGLGAGSSYGPSGFQAVPGGLPGRVGEIATSTYEVFAESTRVVLTDADGGDRRVLMELPEDTGIGSISWQADGARVALVTTTMPDWDGDRQRDNEPPGVDLPNLGSINVQEGLGKVAPEDNPLLRDTALRVFDTAGGTVEKSFANADFPQGLISSLQFGPGGRAILVIALRSDLDGRDHPTYAFPSGIELSVLSAELEVERVLDGPGLNTLSTGFAWADEETLLAAVPSELDTHLHSIYLDTGTATPVWTRKGSMFQLLSGNDAAYFTAMSFDQPMELWSAEIADMAGSAEQVTGLNSAVADVSALRSALVRWTDADGRDLVGEYVYHEGVHFPPTTPGPVVVWQQGGPGGQMISDFGTSVESPYSILPHFGIPVFVANAAGRSVKDPQFFSDMAEGTNFGQLDIDQIAAGVEKLVERGIADPERVGITGCSYGGYFTLQSLRTYPDLYAAGNAQCSLVDLFEEFTFGYTPFISYLMGTSPMADPAEYYRDSPMYGSKDITAPTLLFHGTDDFLPVPLINNIHDQIEINGVPVTFLRVEGEGHGFGHPSSQAYAAQLQIEFFREHLEVGEFEPEPLPEPDPIYLPLVMSQFALSGGG